jgi:hypothetical protein
MIASIEAPSAHALCKYLEQRPPHASPTEVTHVILHNAWRGFGRHRSVRWRPRQGSNLRRGLTRFSARFAHQAQTINFLFSLAYSRLERRAAVPGYLGGDALAQGSVGVGQQHLGAMPCVRARRLRTKCPTPRR